MKKRIISTLTAMCMAASLVGTLAASAADLTEPGHDIFSPVEIEMNEEFSGRISNSQDWYSFTLDQASKVNVTFVSDTSLNASVVNYKIVDLYNDDNNTVFSRNGNYRGTDVLYLTPGNYCIVFYSGYNFDYKARLRSTPVEESFDSKTNNNIGKASEIELNMGYSGVIANNDSADYYKFDVEEEGQITLNFDGDMKSVDWKIYNDKEKVIESGRFNKGEADDMISAMKSYVSTGGTYYLGLTSADKSFGSYTVSIDYRKDYNNVAVSDLFACADVNKDHMIDSIDASIILAYYSYLSTGGTITDLNEWLDKQ